MLTKEALLKRLDLTAPGMEEAEKRVKEGKEDEAIEAVIAHFRTRTKPNYLL